MKRIIFATLVLGTPAVAKDIVVNDQDQQSILQICEAAAKSPAIPIEITAQVAAWCVQWKQRMAEKEK